MIRQASRKACNVSHFQEALRDRLSGGKERSSASGTSAEGSSRTPAECSRSSHAAEDDSYLSVATSSRPLAAVPSGATRWAFWSTLTATPETDPTTDTSLFPQLVQESRKILKILFTSTFKFFLNVFHMLVLPYT